MRTPPLQLVATQLANIKIDDLDASDYFDDVLTALWAVKDQTCGVALFCTTHRVTDEFDVPNTQDVVCVSLR